MTAKFQLRNDTVVLTDSEEGSDEGMIFMHKSHDNVIICEGVLQDLPCRFLASDNNTFTWCCETGLSPRAHKYEKAMFILLSVSSSCS
jgi:hypothetical protein